MPRAGRGYRKVFLHVHVSLLSTSCTITARRFYYGRVAGVECGTHTAASEQLGLFAGLPHPVPVFILIAYSLHFLVFLRYWTSTAAYLAILDKSP